MHRFHACFLLSVALALPMRVSAQDVAVIPPSVFAHRRERAMRAAPHSLLLIRAQPEHMALNQDGFRQAPDFYYYTGLANAVGALLAIDSPRQESWLFLPDAGALRPGFAARLTAPYGYIKPGAATASQLGMEHAVPAVDFIAFLRQRLIEDSTLVLRTPSGADTPNDSALALTGADVTATWKQSIRSQFPHARFDRLGANVARLREVKDSFEIAILRRVARSSAKAALAGIRALRPGRRQRDAELDVLSACVRDGASGVSFWPFLMSGANANLDVGINALADYEFLDRRMKAGELVRVDVGCAREHYEGDVGRTAPASGIFDDGQREAWNLLIAAYRAGLRDIKPGLTPQQVFQASQREAERLRPTLRTRFGKQTAEFILSREGTAEWGLHGVGVSSSEWNPDTLRAGNVLAFEPVLVVDGVALYLEDMVLITSNGSEVLTTGLPYTAEEIERAMDRSRSTTPLVPSNPI